METKPWYLSKTLWVNVIALIALFCQKANGFVISPEEQMGILAVVNLVLRLVTNKGLSK